MHHCCGGGDEGHDHHHHSAHAHASLGTFFVLTLDAARGVLTQESIAAAEVIEEAGVLAFTSTDYEQVKHTPIAARFVSYITERGDKLWVMPLGSAALCHKNADPSARLEYHETQAGDVFCTLMAKKPLAVGEAVTL